MNCQKSIKLAPNTPNDCLHRNGHGVLPFPMEILPLFTMPVLQLVLYLFLT